MDTKEILISQFGAGLKMLKGAITSLSDETWYSKKHKHQPWHVAYHVLFYTDLYLSKDEKSFRPWTKHRKDYNFLGEIPWEPGSRPVTDSPYTQAEVLEYLNVITDSLRERIEHMDLSSPSGFYWLQFTKLELALYNLRHIAHHTGQLIGCLRNEQDMGIDWVACIETWPEEKEN